MFTSTASQGSGQETTIMTAVTQLAHHGMIYVPTGYGSGGSMFGLDAAKVGTYFNTFEFLSDCAGGISEKLSSSTRALVVACCCILAGTAV